MNNPTYAAMRNIVKATQGLDVRVSFGNVRGEMGVRVRVVDPGQLAQVNKATRGVQTYGVPLSVQLHRSANPTRRENFLGGGLKIRSIHPPPDPNVNVLDADARAFWDGVRADAYEYYTEARAPRPREVAERTAWRAVRMHWEPGQRRSPWVLRTHTENPGRAQKIPEPNDLIVLGKILEYVWINEDGSLDVRRWAGNRPTLRWDDQAKTLWVFPNAPDSKSCAPVPPDMKGAAKMFKRWSQRDPECMNEFPLEPSIMVSPMGVGDSIAYRSDKWHAKSHEPDLEGSEEYFHQFTDGVWVWQDSDTVSPNAILMRGGQLDVEERGIIH